MILIQVFKHGLTYFCFNGKCNIFTVFSLNFKEGNHNYNLLWHSLFLDLNSLINPRIPFLLRFVSIKWVTLSKVSRLRLLMSEKVMKLISWCHNCWNSRAKNDIQVFFYRVFSFRRTIRFVCIFKLCESSFFFCAMFKSRFFIFQHCQMM